MIKGQGTFSWVIVLLILITLFLDNVWISLGENLCLSPLGLRGYKSQIKEVKRARTISRCLFYMYQSVHLVEVSVKGESTVFCFLSFRLYGSLVVLVISNGNRTEWSPIRSVIIRVINKIGRPHSGSPICLITSMITDRIG